MLELQALNYAPATASGPLMQDVALKADIGRPVLVAGASGSGKTSILRAIAGFLPVRGTIRFNGVTWADGTTHLVPQKRPVGFLFQDDYLFPR